MHPFTEAMIRGCLVNCSKGEASRIKLPVDFRDTDWDQLDFLGWVDPSAPLRAVLVVPVVGRPVGVVLRRAEARRGSALRSSMCGACRTVHGPSGVALFSAHLAGSAGRNGNSVGDYFCADLACSLYIRGKRVPGLRAVQTQETLTLDEKIDRTMSKLSAFVQRITAAA